VAQLTLDCSGDNLLHVRNLIGVSYTRTAQSPGVFPTVSQEGGVAPVAIRRVVLYFNELGGIPANAGITAAALRITVHDFDAPGENPTDVMTPSSQVVIGSSDQVLYDAVGDGTIDVQRDLFLQNPDEEVTANLIGGSIVAAIQAQLDAASGFVVVALKQDDETVEQAVRLGDVAAAHLDVTYTPPPTANAGLDQSVLDEHNVQLAGAATNAASTLWTTNGTGTFDDAASLNAMYTPSAADISNRKVILTLTAEPIAPCVVSASDEMTVGITITALVPIIGTGGMVRVEK